MSAWFSTMIQHDILSLSHELSPQDCFMCSPSQNLLVLRRTTGTTVRYGRVWLVKQLLTVLALSAVKQYSNPTLTSLTLECICGIKKNWVCFFTCMSSLQGPVEPEFQGLRFLQQLIQCNYTDNVYLPCCWLLPLKTSPPDGILRSY